MIMVWPINQTSCSPLWQGEKRREHCLVFCLDFEEKRFPGCGFTIVWVNGVKKNVPGDWGM
jgi:hypothetical protein